MYQCSEEIKLDMPEADANKLNWESDADQLNSPFLHVIDGKRHSPTSVESWGDVDSIEMSRLPNILHRTKEITNDLTRQHFFHIHVLHKKLRLIWQGIIFKQEEFESS